MGERAQEAREVAVLEAQLRADAKKLALVQEIGQALSSALDLDGLLALIMEKITILMEADRSTLYLLSDDGHELWSKILQGGEVLEIRLRVGEGIAGWVAQSGETVNIPDAYSDRRFYPAVDLRSGYRTRSILCMPMEARGGKRMGVIQVLNKADGPFTAEDELLLSALASQAAVAIENSRLYHSVVAKNVELATASAQLQEKTDELDILFTIEREVNETASLGELLDRLLRRAMQVFGAGAGSILLRERGTNDLYFRSTAGDKGEVVRRMRVTIPDGIVGWVAAHRTPLIANDPAADPRHDRRLAETIGHRPRNLVCVPLVGHSVGPGGDDDELLGVIELLDKDDPAGWGGEDLELLGLIAGQASRAIQLARSKEERMNQDRLASIGQMLAGVLHDLKTPMTIVSGYAQLMAQIDDPDQRASYVEQILRQFDHMAAMTKEVLAFARGEANLLVRRVYLHKFLAEVHRHLEHELAGKEVRLVMDAAYKGAAYFDEQKVLRLIHNIARNAVQAMPGGGTFRVATRVEGDELVLEFADTGSGIPPEMEGRLFELFATSGKKDGTGLGLAIVKKIVDEHRGTIGYESRRGGADSGTTFTIRLPLERPAIGPDAGPGADDDDDAAAETGASALDPA